MKYSHQTCQFIRNMYGIVVDAVVVVVSICIINCFLLLSGIMCVRNVFLSSWKISWKQKNVIECEINAVVQRWMNLDGNVNVIFCIFIFGAFVWLCSHLLVIAIMFDWAVDWVFVVNLTCGKGEMCHRKIQIKWLNGI